MLIKQDFESYWRKNNEVLDNLVLVDMKVVDKRIGVFYIRGNDCICVGKRGKDSGKDYIENHDSKVKFNYRKNNTGWKLETTEDIKFF